MPIYEFQCAEHGRFERMYFIAEKPDVAVCGVSGFNPQGNMIVTCNLPCEWVPSIPVMRGDSLGTKNKSYIYDEDFGYIDSRSQLEAKAKAAGKVILHDSNDREGFAKDVEGNAKSIEERADLKRDRLFNEIAHDGRFEAAMAGTLTKENSGG